MEKLRGEGNPWKTLGSRVVYENPWIKLREDQVIRPDGKPGIYGVVETRVATGVVALTANREIYLVGQYRYPINLYSWEIIEGGNEGAETPRQAAERELREEAGLVAKNWVQLGPPYHLSNCFSSEEGVVFLATGLTEVESEPDGTEVLSLKKMPFVEAVRLVESGEISDSVSIVGILRAREYMKIHGDSI